MVLSEAIRATRAVLACATTGDRTASDELRTCMFMLMIAAPILSESKRRRAFLEARNHRAICWFKSNIRTRRAPSNPSRLTNSSNKRCSSSKSRRPRCAYTADHRRANRPGNRRNFSGRK